LGKVASRRVIGASMLLFVTGCQLVFGDFMLERSPAPLGDSCLPDTFRCTGERLEVCSDDRQSWALVEQCEDADHCDPAAPACRECAQDQWACNGALLESCDGAGHWQTQPAPCESADLCTVATDRGSAACRTPACPQAGAYSCDENRLLRCSPDLDQLVLVDRCGSRMLCDATKAQAQAQGGVRGTCVPPVCLAGTFACDGATLERCRDDETDWEVLATCSDATSCNPLAGACTPCMPGDTACSGAELWVCGASGFAKAATCATPELCDPVAGACEPPGCAKPGAVRCVNSDVTELEECGNDGRWAVRDACASRPLCSESAGACLPPACGPGDARCLGQVRQKCSGDLTHWVDGETCSDGLSCDPDGCHTGCTEGTYRCDDSMLELCVAGSWAAQNHCATPALCDAVNHLCQNPTCVAGEFMCSGTIMTECTAGRDGLMDFLTCSDSTYCDPDPAVGTGLPTCDACEPLSYSCLNGNELHLCNADGTAAPLVAACPGGCSVAGNVPTCVQMP
jgi:hypothetical protein